MNTRLSAAARRTLWPTASTSATAAAAATASAGFIGWAIYFGLCALVTLTLLIVDPELRKDRRRSQIKKIMLKACRRP